MQPLQPITEDFLKELIDFAPSEEDRGKAFGDLQTKRNGRRIQHAGTESLRIPCR